ncbi:hypothetical protein A0H76_660 [Hepatospora eriocheir]|uniref:Uncharacterized protein n=1 Tax=Hepatospora eriocheir TaxID=1081669 RepID=A0A1X0QL10_9MICR|nr:hypothetical protein A0H76_660 [Hepatospora eriocheir]
MFSLIIVFFRFISTENTVHKERNSKDIKVNMQILLNGLHHAIFGKHEINPNTQKIISELNDKNIGLDKAFNIIAHLKSNNEAMEALEELLERYNDICKMSSNVNTEQLCVVEADLEELYEKLINETPIGDSKNVTKILRKVIEEYEKNKARIDLCAAEIEETVVDK